MAIVPVRSLPRLARRRRDAHKGDFGRVLVIGGSRGMVGAPALAANAALRSGCGLVQLAVPDVIQQAAAELAPCATSLALPSTSRGTISARRAIPMLAARWRGWADVLAVGPGMDRSADGRRLVAMILRRSPASIVLDADGLNNASDSPGLLRAARPAALVLTPHPGEMARLLRALRIAFDVRTPRTEAAVSLARACRATVALKGHRTVVTDGRRVFVNPTGNPGMATGGSGDVLTGVIAGLLGQRLAAFEATVLGVFVHGRAGDLSARRVGEVSLIATDLIEAIPAAFASVSRRR